jgi:hypothetical protein
MSPIFPAARVVKYCGAAGAKIPLLTPLFASLYCAPFRKSPGRPELEAGTPASQNERSTVLTVTRNAA